MVFKLTKDEVLKVCQNCQHFDKLHESCNSENNSSKVLSSIRKCAKWDEYFGGPCLFRG